MADKEATVYIVDVGRSMGQKHHSRQQTDLEWAMTWVWDKITSIVATERKTLLQGIIALKTDGTSNELGDEDAYHHITVLQELSQILFPDLRSLQESIRPSGTDEGDAISALVLATHMIDKTCKKLKYKRKIVLITNGQGSIDASDLEPICEKVKADGIEIIVLGVDFDDSDYSFKEEGKSLQKRENEETLRRFTADCGGAFGTLAQAVDELGEPRLKETKPVPSYRGTLTLGDPATYPDSALVIDVERYPRTMVRRPQTASSFVIKKEGEPQDQRNGMTGNTVMGGTDEADGQLNELEAVRNQLTYYVEDPTVKDGKRALSRDDLARGYEYGRTAVHISEADESITQLETRAALEIIGFIPWDNYNRYMSMSTSNIIIAQKSNSKAIMALSSFVHALYELQSFAVAKLVPKEGKDPIIEVLAPLIEPDYECLIDVQLPFAEDVRSYRFPPLDKVITVSGKVLKEHRYLPNDRLMAAMDTYVDSMDLSEFDRDDENNPSEYLLLTDAFSPVLHRIDQAVRFRAVHPTEPIPPPYDILVKYRDQPDKLKEKTKNHLAELVAAADVKKLPPKLAGRKRARETTKPLSGLDVDALLGGKEKRLKVVPENSIPTFRQMLDTAEDPNAINNAAAQMGAIIEKRIKDSFGDSAYGQVLEELTVFREEMKEMDEPGLWNEFVRKLKKRILGGEFGEGREEMWWQIRKAKLGLHEGKMPGDGRVSVEEAREFLSSK